MIPLAIAYVFLVGAAVLFVLRLLIGPSVPDRIVAIDGLLVTTLGGVMVHAAWIDSAVNVDTVLVVALLGFVGTGALARYVERRGG